jgi:hypothetical protein
MRNLNLVFGNNRTMRFSLVFGQFVYVDGSNIFPDPFAAA